MNQQIKKQWVKALRSGKYLQGTNALHQDNNFCCLGVLCDLAVKNKIVKPSDSPIDNGNDYKTWSYGQDENGNPEWEQLPPVVAEWAGIDDLRGVFSDEFPSLAEMNDNGQTFEEIADIIKKYF